MTLLAAHVSLKGTLGDNRRVKIPDASLVQGLGDATQVLQDQGVGTDDFSTAMPSALSSWTLTDLATEGGWSIPNIHIPADRDASAPRPRHFQGALTKLTSSAHFDTFMGALDALPEASRSPKRNGPYEG